MSMDNQIITTTEKRITKTSSYAMNDCSKYAIQVEDFEEAAASSEGLSSAETSGSENGERPKDELMYYQWISIDGKMTKVSVSSTFEDLEEKVIAKINEIKMHLFIKKEQYKVYNQLKSEMPENASSR